MNLRLIAVGAGAVAFTTVLGACGTEQQDPQCVVARAVSDGSTGSFAATYSLKEGQDASRACAQLKPEPVGLQKYFSQDPAAKDTVGVRSARMGSLLKTNASRLSTEAPSDANSVGALTTDAPGADNFCEVPTLAPARLVAEATSSGTGSPQPALSVTYEWSNLRIYNTPQIPGTQFIADLKYTENDCTADYKVRGIWPVVKCANSKKEADDTLCDPRPDYSVGRLRGSGINPLFPVKCDPDVKICVLTGEVPSDQNP